MPIQKKSGNLSYAPRTDQTLPQVDQFKNFPSNMYGIFNSSLQNLVSSMYKLYDAKQWKFPLLICHFFQKCYSKILTSHGIQKNAKFSSFILVDYSICKLTTFIWYFYIQYCPANRFLYSATCAKLGKHFCFSKVNISWIVAELNLLPFKVPLKSVYNSISKLTEIPVYEVLLRYQMGHFGY